MNRRIAAGRFPRLTARLRRANHPGGFTLVELLAAVSIIAIIALPLTLAIAMGFRTVFDIDKKLAASGDAQTISAYFPADVQSVDAGQPATSTPDGVNPTDPVNVGTCAPTLAEQSLITLLWDHDLGVDGQSVARYVSSGKGTASKLIRRFCKGTADPVETVVAKNFGTGDPETGPDASTYLVSSTTGAQTPSCTGDACTIQVNGDYKYSLSVNRRVPGVNGSATTPGQPTNVHGIGGNHRATLYWTDPPNGGSPITGFAIETTPGNVVSGPYPPGSGATGVNINGLTNFQSYTFRVRAINVIGNGPYSDPSAPVTPGPTVPDPPTTGTATADPAVNGRASLTWSLPSDYNDGGSAISGFKVYALHTPSPPVTVDVPNPGATSATVDGLQDNTRYQLQVTASNNSGEGAPSTLSNTILTLPGKPAISLASGTGVAGELRVTFAVPSGGDFADLTNFRLHVLQTNTFTTPVAAATSCPGTTPTTCTLTVGGLALGQNYDITVQAQNATGWGPESDPAINVDITPPAVSITSPVTGSASNNTQPVFTGTAGTDGDDLPGIVVKIYAGTTATGSPVRSFTTTSTGGTWSTLAGDVTPALPSGQYTAQAEQTDSAGNVGGSNAVTFVVDTAAPTIGITFPVAGNTYNLAGWNSGCTPTGVCGTATDAAPGTVALVTATVQRSSDSLYWDGTAWVAGPVNAPVTGTTSWKVALPAASLTNDSYTVTAQATDAAGNVSGFATSTFTADTTAPSVTVNQAAGQADPTNGSTINFTVVFSEPVVGFASNDLTIGGTTTGTKTGTITGTGPTYNVAVTGMTSSGTVTLSIAANRVTDPAGNNNSASTSTDNTVTRDVTAPTVTVNKASGQADPTNVMPANYTVVFSEPVTGFDNTDLTFGGSAPGPKTGVVTGGPTTYNVAVSGVTGSGSLTLSVAANRAQDVAGNNNTASTSSDNSVSIDLTAPTVTLTNPANGSASTDTTPQLSGACTSGDGIVTATVQLGGTTVQTRTSNCTGGAWSVNANTLATNTTYTAFASQTDAVGNTGTSATNTFSIDATPPTVTVNQAAGQADPVNGGPINYTVTFSEPVTGFASNDLTFGGSAGGTKSGVITGAGPVYNVAVTGMTGNGTVTLSIAANRVTDLAGNNNTASTSTDNSVTLDTAAPTVTVNQAAGQPDPTATLPINYTVTFSEPVTGFDDSDLTLAGTAGGTRSAVVSGGPTVYSVAVSGVSGSGTSTVSVAANRAQDLAGNNNTASTSSDNSVVFDATPPTVTINQASGQADPTGASPMAFTATFSESVTGFTGSDISFTGSTATGSLSASISGTGPTYTVNVTGMTGNGTVIASIPAGGVTDTVGNPNVASTSTDNTVTYDNVPPTVTVNQASGQADPTNGSPINFTVVFSDAVTGFAVGDLTLGGTSGGTKAGTISGTGPTYNVAVTGMTGQGTVTLSIPAGAVTDTAGNGNTASTSTDNSVTYDSVPPAVTITSVNGAAVTFPFVTTGSVTSISGACTTGDGNVSITLTGVGAQGPNPVACSAGAWSYTLSPTFSTPGTTVAAATQTDAVGNLGTSGSKSIKITLPIVYVATPGNGGAAGNDGSSDAPLDSVGAAITLAQSRGWTEVRVGQGTFNAGTTGLQLVSGFTISGGWNAGFTAQTGANTSTTIQGGQQAAFADGKTGITLNLLMLSGMGDSATDRSVYGLRAINGSSITLTNVRVTSAVAFAGVAGTSGASGSTGAAGTVGTAGSNNNPTGGPGGTTFTVGGTGGAGGNASAGSTGAVGSGGVAGGGGGARGSGFLCSTAGADGGTGTNGAASGTTGTAGTAGAQSIAGAGTTVWTGAATSVGGNGTVGGSGASGAGGGGGGASGGTLCGAARGGGGGGGGGGGQGGSGGPGGQAGGASIGIYTYNSTVTLDGSSSVVVGNGGQGGTGGTGGSGGTGGTGGTGGAAQANSAGDGGKGGNGGQGASGGTGGGGAGGPSVGLFKRGTGAINQGAAAVSTGSGGAGGTGATTGQAGTAAAAVNV